MRLEPRSVWWLSLDAEPLLCPASSLENSLPGAVRGGRRGPEARVIGGWSTQAEAGLDARPNHRGSRVRGLVCLSLTVVEEASEAIGPCPTGDPSAVPDSYSSQTSSSLLQR